MPEQQTGEQYITLTACSPLYSLAERIVAYGSMVVPGDRGLERLSPTRIAELRMRLESGAYNSPEVLTELAMRLLESGEL